VHPCNCTLIAHESCLLEWIKSSQGDRNNNALKCPQCGAKYDMESDNPLPLRLLNGVNKFVSAVCRKTMVIAVICTAGGGE
jgi:E3 ubiquitin-protein ligase DOA10